MAVISRLLPVAFPGSIALAFACGGGDSTGPSASAVTGVAGDNQEAPTGTQLASPLSLVVLGAGGQPMQGVSVRWTVTPTGGATFTPPTSTSDAQGTASTTVKLGVVTGAIVIQANVPGVQPVVFNELALDPCQYLAPYTLGTTVDASLAATDCHVVLGGAVYYYDFYRLDLPTSQQSFRVSMGSTAFDTYVDLFRYVDPFRFPQGYLGSDDDIQPTVITNSQMDIIAAPGGSFVIGANSYDPLQTGPYTLSVVTRPATIAGCELVWLTRGVNVSDAVATTDCSDTVGGRHYFDEAAIVADSGTVLTISEHSAAFNSYLKLVVFNSTGPVVVAFNDDSANAGTTLDSYVTYTVPQTGVYGLFIGTSAAGETGAYTLAISPSTTLSASRVEDTRGAHWLGRVPFPISRPRHKGWHD